MVAFGRYYSRYRLLLKGSGRWSIGYFGMRLNTETAIHTKHLGGTLGRFGISFLLAVRKWALGVGFKFSTQHPIEGFGSCQPANSTSG